MIEQTCEKWKWKRKKEGWIAGVCEGLGHSYGVNPLVLRLLFVFSFLIFGSGALLYLVLAIILPSDSSLENYNRSQLFGVCYRISQLTGIELPIIRVGITLGALISFILFLLTYFGLALFFYFQDDDFED